MNLFDLVAKLTLDSSEYEQGLNKAEKQGSGFGGKLKNAMKVGGAAVAALGAATGALAGSFVKGADAVADYGDTIDKQSQKMGISARSYQEWNAILQHSGSSIDAMSKGMITLQKKAADGAEAFEALGLTQEQVASMSTEELFAATISGLQNMEEGAERTALASELFGGATKELGPLLNTSAEETEAMRKRVNELGGVMSDDAVKAAAKYKDSLQDMQTAFGGLKNNLMSEFLPALTTVVDGLTALVSGDSSGLGQIKEGINQFASNLSEVLPDILKFGSEIVVSLATAITENLPVLLPAAFGAIKTIGEGILMNLPMILESGLQMILTLAQGLIDALPEMIPTIVDVVLQIVDMLTQPDTLSALIDASIAIIMALANGLIEALPRLLEKAPEIVGNLMTAIVQNAPKLLKSAYELIVTLGRGIVQNLGLMLQKGGEIVQKVVSGIGQSIQGLWSAGLDIVRGIWKGISDGFGWIKGKITGWVGDLLGFFKRLLGIKSPSKVFADQVGRFMAEGVGLGFLEAMPGVEKQMQDAMPDPSGLMGGMNFSVSGGARGRFDYELMALLRDIRDNMDTDLVLDDGTVIGWMDKALGRRATQRARGNA